MTMVWRSITSDGRSIIQSLLQRRDTSKKRSRAVSGTETDTRTETTIRLIQTEERKSTFIPVKGRSGNGNVYVSFSSRTFGGDAKSYREAHDDAIPTNKHSNSSALPLDTTSDQVTSANMRPIDIQCLWDVNSTTNQNDSRCKILSSFFRLSLLF